MTSSRPKSSYWRGARDGLPFMLVVTPFSAVFGVIAVESGLSVGETIGFSTVVVAGAAQFAALQMMVEGAPFLIVLLTALAVNLRMAMYSASLAPHLGAAPLWQRGLVAYLNFDNTYALSIARYEDHPTMTVAEKFSYFMGVASPIVPMWVAGTIAGAVAGARIPEAWSLDFAVPITFLALTALMLRTRAHWAAACVSVVVALVLRGLPLNTGLLIAAIAAMCTGAIVETKDGRQ
ncbi:MAG: AzlC family ABC transporter permease [Pseudomonadota bacterium]